jgi:hypothetical protein
MPVYDRSYRRWDGELKRRALRFAPITAMGVKNALGTKGGWLFTLLLRTFMVVSLLPTLFLFFLNGAVAFRWSFLPEDFLRFLDTLRSVRAVQYPLLTQFNLNFLTIYTVLFGSGLIAKDRASGALPLYLSRPLTLADYVLGKAGIIAWFVASFTLVPNLMLWLFGIATDESPTALRDALPSLGPILVQGMAIIAVYALTILAVSSLCRRPMFAGLIWFTMMLLTWMVVFGVSMHTGWFAVRAIAPNGGLLSIGYHLFGIAELRESAQQVTGTGRAGLEAVFLFFDPVEKVPAGWAWLSVGAWSLLSLAVLLRSLRRQEIVGDSGRR